MVSSHDLESIVAKFVVGWVYCSTGPSINA